MSHHVSEFAAHLSLNLDVYMKKQLTAVSEVPRSGLELEKWLLLQSLRLVDEFVCSSGLHRLYLHEAFSSIQADTCDLTG